MITWAASCPHPPWHLVIYSNSIKTVDSFSSLDVNEGYNNILLLTAHLFLDHKISLQVLHIPGAKNTIVDTLSDSSMLSTRVSLTCVSQSLNPPLKRWGGRDYEPSLQLIQAVTSAALDNQALPTGRSYYPRFLL